jgi:hypothetical protein
MEHFDFQTRRVMPQRVFIAAWLAWFVCFLLMPVSTVFYGNFQTLLLFVGANLALWCGLSFASYSTTAATRFDRLCFDPRSVRVVLLCLVVLGFVAVSAKVVDLIAYRGILKAASFTDGRQRLLLNGLNLFSSLYFGLSPAIVAGGILAIVLFRREGFTRITTTALVLFCVNPVFSFVFGGRSILFMTAALGVIAWLLITPKISRRSLFWLFFLTVVVFFITMYLFVSRVVEKVGVHVDRLAVLSDYTKLVPLDADVVVTMRDAPEFVRFLIYYVTSVGQYVIHGFFEFFYIVVAKRPDDCLLWGRYQFTLYDLALKAILGPEVVPDLEKCNPATGLFSTFWGPAYLDFGYFIVVYGLVVGYVVSLVRRLVERGDLFAVPLYTLLVFQILLVPIVSAVLLGSAIVLDLGLFGIWLLARLYCWYGFRGRAYVDASALD